MPSVRAAHESEQIPSVKDLASSEPSLRRSCLSQILSHLVNRSPSIPPTSDQCLQLWRGFSVALYMHDSKNALSVQTLINNLASSLSTMYEKDIECLENPSEAVAAPWHWLTLWTTAFWETICREWSGIDQWRMNKYLLLIRLVVRKTFKILSRASRPQTSMNPMTVNGKNPSEAVDNQGAMQSLPNAQIVVLKNFPLSPRDRKVPDGLRLHVLDVWMEELDKMVEDATAAADDDDQEADQAAETVQNETQRADELRRILMQPIRDLAKDALSKSVRMKAKEIVRGFDEVNSSS